MKSNHDCADTTNRPTSPQRTDRTYLTLGEGDFSWSVDLSKHLSDLSTKMQPEEVYTTRLIATGFDTKEELSMKYRDFNCTLRRICKMSSDRFQVQIKHGVNAIGDPDATITTPELLSTKANVVFFNHPHLGTEDATLHSHFMHHLFHTVRNRWLYSLGLFVVTLADGQYERWRCQEAAAKQRFRLLDRYYFVSNAAEDSVYELRRHQTGKSFRKRTSGSYSYVFTRSEDDTPPTLMNDLPWFQKIDERRIDNAMGKQLNDLKFSCPHCNRKFREERSVKNHILTKHQIGKKRKLECTSCDPPRSFDCEEALRDHQQAKHQGIHKTISPDWVTNTTELSPSHGRCMICGIVFTQGFGLDEHLASFLPQSPKEIPCRFCSKVFGSRRAKCQHENFCSLAHSRAHQEHHN